MKVPSSAAASSERPDAAMTPMIDVVFLLLIFFIWTASFQAIEAILPSRLTSAGHVGPETDLPQEDFERIVVGINDEPRTATWTINSQPVSSLGALEQRLGELAAIKTELPVVIDPAENVPFGHVIDVYDVSLRVGLSNIQLTTRAE